jgi:hypothetical protein
MLNVVSLFGVSDPKAFRGLMQKNAAAFKEVEANGTKTETTYKPDAEKIGSTSIDVLTGKITVSDDAPGAELTKTMMLALYGEDGPTTRTAYLKDKVLQLMGGTKADMEAALKSAEATSRTPSAAIQAVRSKLGTKPNFVGLIDIASLAVKGLAIAKDFGGDELPIDPDQITKGLTIKPSYLGFGVEVQDAAVSVKTVLPVDQIKSLVQIGMKVQGARNGDN